MPSSKEAGEAFRAVTESWVEAHRNNDGTVNPGVLATGLAVTNLLRKEFPLSDAVVATKSQVKGQGGRAIERTLKAFGEDRKFLSEAGRTSRGSRQRGIELGQQLSTAGVASGFEQLDKHDREAAVDFLQRWLVDLVAFEYFDQQRLKPEIRPDLPARFAIRSIIAEASDRGGNTAGAVAQHLVGAKLALRFPTIQIGRDNYTTADLQTARPGDFQVGDTAFHVTMSPSEALIRRRCKQNLDDGFRCTVVVPESKVIGALQLAEIAELQGRIDVVGLESFVGRGIEEMAEFQSSAIRVGLRSLLEEYNERVREIESNPSMQVEIPANL